MAATFTSEPIFVSSAVNESKRCPSPSPTHPPAADEAKPVPLPTIVSPKTLKRLDKLKKITHIDVTALYDIGVCYDSTYGLCLYKEMNHLRGQELLDVELQKDLVLSKCPYYCRVLGAATQFEPEDTPRHIIFRNHSDKTLHEVLTLLAGCDIPQRPEVYVRWATQVIRAVAFLHEHGYTHNNLRATTIHFDSDVHFNTANIRMFPPSTFRGYSGLTCNPRDSHFEFLGDTRYGHPEGFSDIKDDAHANADNLSREKQRDVYNLGLVLAQIFYKGHPLPFQGYSGDWAICQALRKGTLAYPESLVVASPFDKCPAIDQVIRMCCHANPFDRPTMEWLINKWKPVDVVKSFGGCERLLSD